jgi:hypothetical protein
MDMGRMLRGSGRAGQVRYTARMLRCLLLLALAACGGQIDGPTSTGIQSITLHSTGGFIGEDITYAISKDGTVVISGHGTDPTGTKHGSDAATFFENVKATQVLGVPAHSYVPANPCCDLIEDDLTIVSNDGTTQTLEWDVIATDSAPPEVISALQLVHAYIHAAH